MNRTLILFFLLLNFSFSSSLMATELKVEAFGTEMELSVENENSKKDSDKEDFYVEVISMTNEVCSFSSPSFSTSLKHDTFENLPFRPPIV